jgi:hypothetical protein
MDNDEYNKLFHTLELNLVAFKPLMQCDKEVLKLVNAAIEAEREACANVCDSYDVAEDVCSSDTAEGIAIAIRARGQG